jgi:zinc transport system substrate-binding protein
VEKAAAQSDGTAVDLLEGVRLRAADDGIPGVRGEVDGERLEGDKDPHVWVDPVLFEQLSRQIEDAYAAADPAREDRWRANGERYRAGLAGLDEAFARGLKDCRTRTLVTSHAAFGYLADRYDLRQAPIAGISPDDEPDPQSLAAVAELAERDGVETVFFETLVPPDLAKTVASEIGATTDALDPVEGLDEEGEAAGRTYASIQRDNLQRLTKGLGCTTG